MGYLFSNGRALFFWDNSFRNWVKKKNWNKGYLGILIFSASIWLFRCFSVRLVEVDSAVCDLIFSASRLHSPPGFASLAAAPWLVEVDSAVCDLIFSASRLHSPPGFASLAAAPWLVVRVRVLLRKSVLQDC